MKKIIAVLGCIFLSIACFSQADSTDYYKAFLTIPHFSLNRVPDSSVFTNSNLPYNKPVLIIFFSPDCDHCQHEATELVQKKDLLSGVSILMVSQFSIKEINDFYQKFELNTIPDLTITQDFNFRLGSIFKMPTYPAMYLYDTDKNLLKAFVGNVTVEKIISNLN